MRYEMNCIFNNGIGENLRQELAAGKLTGPNAVNASWCELRGIAMLELGFLDIELNINTADTELEGDSAETEPVCDYFICVKSGPNVTDWESFGYADDYIGDAGTAHVDWSAENWEELLFADMLKSLVKFTQAANDRHGLPADLHLSFLRPNELTVSMFG